MGIYPDLTGFQPLHTHAGADITRFRPGKRFPVEMIQPQHDRLIAHVKVTAAEFLSRRNRLRAYRISRTVFLARNVLCILSPEDFLRREIQKASHITSRLIHQQLKQA